MTITESNAINKIPQKKFDNIAKLEIALHTSMSFHLPLNQSLLKLLRFELAEQTVDSVTTG